MCRRKMLLHYFGEVRGVVSLPAGTGKVTRVLALCTPDQELPLKRQVPLCRS